jgi:leader peptidase (prepilin peptidase) / N-methyltransferase
MIILFIFGLFVGSFLGVLVDRIPKGKSFIKGRSYCDSCKKELKWYDLVPVFSYLFLKGNCRYCKTKLSLAYPVIEITTGILFVLTYFISVNDLTIYNFKFIAYFSYLIFMISSFIVVLFTDLKYGIIPDKIIVAASAINFLWLFFNPLSLILNHLLSAVGSLIFFIAISYVFYMVTKKEGMGGGDIKLSFLMGLFLGFPNIIISLYLAFLTGALASIILILWKKKILKDSLPFGPFLIIGVFISLFYGNQIYLFVLKTLGM